MGTDNTGDAAMPGEALETTVARQDERIKAIVGAIDRGFGELKQALKEHALEDEAVAARVAVVAEQVRVNAEEVRIKAAASRRIWGVVSISISVILGTAQVLYYTFNIAPVLAKISGAH